MKKRINISNIALAICSSGQASSAYVAGIRPKAGMQNGNESRHWAVRQTRPRLRVSCKATGIGMAGE